MPDNILVQVYPCLPDRDGNQKEVVHPTLGWMTRAGLLEKKKEEITLGDRFRMVQGLYIGKKARNLYPEGILVETADFKAAVEQTNTFKYPFIFFIDFWNI